MVAMGKCNITYRKTRDREGMMERYNRILDKAIKVLGGNGYAEGSETDLYVKRFIELYSHQGKVFEVDSEHKITNKLQKPKWPPMGKMSHPL